MDGTQWIKHSVTEGPSGRMRIRYRRVDAGPYRLRSATWLVTHGLFTPADFNWDEKL